MIVNNLSAFYEKRTDALVGGLFFVSWCCLGHGFSVVGSRISREVRVSDFARCWMVRAARVRGFLVRGRHRWPIGVSGDLDWAGLVGLLPSRVDRVAVL